MKIEQSKENYLETILILNKKLGNVRSIDIAKKLEFSKASVSRAIKILKNENFVEIDSNGYIEFTIKGKQLAEKIYERHLIITKWLIQIGVCEEVADEDACRIEHVITDETFNKIKKLVL